MAITFTTWLWGDKYDRSAVLKLYAGVKRTYHRPFRFMVFSDKPALYGLPEAIESKPIENPELIGKGCLCRLRMFDPQWQKRYGLEDHFANLDLDLVMTGETTDIFKREDPFSILTGVNKLNPNPFNGSLMLLQPGRFAEVWTEFSMEALEKAPKHEFPDDQGWIWHKIPKATGWKAGKESGVYAFMKHGWPPEVGANLPHGARIVAFVGYRKPWMFQGLPWVKQYWVE